MILAAGRGERMRPLTDHCPKPLLEVRGKPLMQYHLEALAARAASREVVVNTAWLGRPDRRPLRPPAAPDGPRIRYSHEGRDFGGALETAGGIARALPLLDDVFWLVGRRRVRARVRLLPGGHGALRGRRQAGPCLLVPNPPHNPKGDFGLRPDGVALNQADARYTYSTIGLYRKALFDSLPAGNPRG